MDINSLRSFILFAEYGTLSKVAFAQHRTNAAISAQMKKLSNTYNVKLFEKKGRNLILSTTGIEFLDIARCILNFHDKLITQTSENDTKITIKFGIPSDYLSEYLFKTINYLSNSLDKIQFDLIVKPSRELYNLWQDNELDIVIYSAKDNNKEGTLIAELQGYWFSSNSYSYKDEVPIEIVLFDENCLFHKQAIEGLQKKETTYKVHTITSDSRVICELVENFNVLAAMSNISKTSKMIKVKNEKLPELPKVFVKLLLSKKMSSLEIRPILDIIKPLTSPH